MPSRECLTRGCKVLITKGSYCTEHAAKKPETYARKMRNKGSYRTNRLKALARDGHRCVRCLSVTNLTVDHILPLALGGTNDLENLQTLCDPCHVKKSRDDLSTQTR